MIVEGICAAAAIYAAIRVIFAKNILRKLAYLNVLSFAVAGAIVLLLPNPITIGAAIAYFIGATLESNAIASTISMGGEE